MRHLCPVCQQAFEEPGFCPFDRALLISASGSDAVTQLSVAMPAQKASELLSAAMVAASDPTLKKQTDVERRGTFPITPTPPAQQPTQEPTNARTRPAAPTPGEHHMQALSASEDPTTALASMKARGQSEYDRLVGQTLDGRYYVEKKIGEGGMGVVFAARHAVIERPLAIKVLKREVMRDTATIKRFVQEAKAASRIGHPNIVDVTDFGTTPDGMTYSVMEFVTGATLGTTLRASAPFPIPRAIRVTVQIARALGAAHDKGIVHRDLKPENVFLIDRDGRPDFVKIVDFGIAKVMPAGEAGRPNEPRLTRAGSVFGTPEYMAPEQAAGRGDTDGRVDVYALGVILYEMLTGRVPHKGDSMVRTLAMQMLDPVEPPSKVRPDVGITPELEAVVMRALAKKREQRYQTMSELAAALEQVQPPIGQSLTGSPVYALAPLPPGADPKIVGAPAADTMQPPPIVRPLTEREPSRSRSPTNRLKDEPEFVTRDKPVTFEHVFTEETQLPARRRWPLLLLFALILGAAIGAVALVMKSRAKALEATVHDAAPPPPLAPDAAVIVSVPPDAPLAPSDADIVVVVEPDARRAVEPPPVRDAGAAVLLPTRGVQVQVLTRPEGGILYVGTSYSGKSGTWLEYPQGTKLDVTCTMKPGYKPGKVTIVFDGQQETALCVLERIKICIDNVKNPFDDCVPRDQLEP